MFELNVQNSVLNRLLASTDLSAIVGGRIYGDVPQDAIFPYVTIGEDVATDWSTHYDTGQSISVVMHTWSRARGRRETKRMQSAIYFALNRYNFPPIVPVDPSDPTYDIVGCDFEGSQSFVDYDGLTRHGVSTFRILVELIPGIII